MGTSFSIEGPEALMGNVFPGYEDKPGDLSMERCPDRVRQAVEAVVIQEPPAFGP